MFLSNALNYYGVCFLENGQLELKRIEEIWLFYKLR